MKKFNVTDVRRKNSTVEMTEDQIIAKYGTGVKLDGSVERFGKFFMTFDEIVVAKPKPKPVVEDAAVEDTPKPKTKKKKKAAPKTDEDS